MIWVQFQILFTNLLYNIITIIKTAQKKNVKKPSVSSSYPAILAAMASCFLILYCCCHLVGELCRSGQGQGQCLLMLQKGTSFHLTKKVIFLNKQSCILERVDKTGVELCVICTNVFVMTINYVSAKAMV